MSQKSIFRKITALMLAAYMVIGNISIVGIGLNNVIAEELDTPQIKLERQVEKYVQYDNQAGKGKENIGDISQIETVEISDIYKGYMYSNEENRTTYETTYTQKENIEILNSELMDKLTVNENESKFELENKEKSANIEFKSTTVSEDSFRKILGQDGYIDIYVAENKYATVRYNDADKDGNRAYIVEYVNGDKKETSGKIEYVEGTKQIKIVTSNPLTEGKIELLQEKVIKAEQEEKASNVKAIKELKEIITTKQTTIQEVTTNENGEEVITEKQVENKINQTAEEKIIELKEPTTQMTLDLSNNNISTLSTNKITATIKLNDTNSSCKLFEAGKIELILPANLVSAKIVGAESLYENGLKITNAKIENGKVILNVEGKQTSYDIENISGGVNIVIDLELDIKDTTPSHEETLSLVYGNAKINKNVNVVSKYGMLNVTEILGVLDETSNIEKDITKEVSMNDTQKDISIKNTYINNYSEDIDNLEIIGKIPSQGIKDENGEELQSTFNTKLLNAINVVGKDVEVYYSEDINAVSNSETWKKEISDFSNIKSYKVVLKDTKLKAGEKIEVSYNIQVPADLTYNQVAYATSQISYDIRNNRTTETYKVELKTKRIEGYTISSRVNTAQKIGDLEVTSYMKVGSLNLDSTSTLYENQIVKYGIKVKNTSNNKISNITIKGTVPEGATLIELKKDNYTDLSSAWFNEFSNKEISKTLEIEAGRTYIIEYYVRINDISNDTSRIIQNFNLLIDNDIVKTIENSNMVKKADIEVMMVDILDSSIEIPTGAYTKYAIRVKNLTGNDIKDINILPLTSENINSTYSITGGQENEEISKFDLSANETKTLTLQVYNDSFNNNNSLKENQTVFVGCTAQNVTYYSNEVTREITQNRTSMKVELSSNIQEESIYDGTEIVYTIKVVNTGIVDAKTNIKYNIPEGLKMTRSIIERDNIDDNYSEGEDVLELTEIEIKSGETLEIKVHTKVDGRQAGINQEHIGEDEYKTNYYDIEEIESSVYVSGTNFDSVSSNSIKYKVLYQNEDVNDKEEDNYNSDNEEDNNTGNEGDNDQQNSYSVSGIAWLDSNKDGKRDSEETLISGITVKLINAYTGETVKNSEGNAITATTDNNGIYSFDNLEEGKYLVVFEFDTNKYTVTTYQKERIDSTLNSDAIINNATIDGTEKLVGITDNIEVTNENVANIDIGLIENAKFDLSLDKQVSTITVVNDQGTKTTEYKNANFAKVDLVAKYMNNTNVIVTYKFVIKNEGEVTGYVDRLVDNLPSGLEFSSELNKDWYKGSDGDLYTTSLNGIAIKPGEESEVELILTKETTENTTGTFSNNAELEKISNIEAIEEKTDAKENNKSSADIVISIKTGSATMYIGITMACLAVIGAGAYLIKKKVINRIRL